MSCPKGCRAVCLGRVAELVDGGTRRPLAPRQPRHVDPWATSPMSWACKCTPTPSRSRTPASTLPRGPRRRPRARRPQIQGPQAALSPPRSPAGPLPVLHPDTAFALGARTQPRQSGPAGAEAEARYDGPGRGMAAATIAGRCPGRRAHYDGFIFGHRHLPLDLEVVTADGASGAPATSTAATGSRTAVMSPWTIMAPTCAIGNRDATPLKKTPPQSLGTRRRFKCVAKRSVDDHLGALHLRSFLSGYDVEAWRQISDRDPHLTARCRLR